MDKRNMALFCAAAICFWMYALAFGSSKGAGVLSARGTGADGAQNVQSVQAAPAMTAAEQQAQTEPVGAEAVQTPSLVLNCKAALLVDQATGTVLYEKDADTPLPIASITKVMTLLLTFEAIHAGKITTEDIVPVSPHAFSMGGSQIWLEPGETFKLDEMLRAICVSSANDAAVAVAEYVGGSEPVFVERMNARAAELGMTNTTFKNACGLDEQGHLSTARDVACMSREILNSCPEVLHYTGIWMDTLRGGQTQLVNTNKLLKRYNGITGLKTGTTGGAGVCISASATREGLSLIAVVLGAPSSADRFAAATTLLDYGFAGYEAAALPDLSAAPLWLKTDGGAEDSVGLDYSALPKSLLLPKGSGGGLEAEVTVPESVEAPLARGEAVGSVTVKAGKKILGTYEIRAASDVERLDFGSALRLLLENLVSP